MGLRKRYDEILARIESSARKVGRNPDDITLVAVSKTFSAEKIFELYEFGHKNFGESRLQEALPKIQALPSDIKWHFVGEFQSNKAKKIAQTFTLIHSLATESALMKLNQLTEPVAVLLEINIAEEAQKAGLLPGALDRFLQSALECKQVQIEGLMTIGPATKDPEESRLWFRKLRELAEPHPNLVQLSMGMSQDFEQAVQEGSTLVRVGTALFGER